MPAGVGALPAAAAIRLAVRGGRRALAVVAVVVVVSGIAVLSVHSAKYGLAAAAIVLLVGLAAFDLAILPCVAVVGTIVIVRVSSATTNLSASDALLFFATLSALPLFKLHEDSDARAILGLVGIYEAFMLIAVLYNPYRSDFVEWGHEAFLAGGSLVVGWVVGRRGHARPVLGTFLVGSAGLACWAVAYVGTHHFHAASMPLGYQKNYVGDLLGFSVLVAYANPDYLALSPRARRYFIAVCLAGLAASQARQGEIGLIVAMLVVLHRRDGIRSHAKVVGLLAIPALAYIGFEVKKQFVSTNQFNSVHQRLSWYHDSLQLFHLSPWLGEGLRWWYTGRFSFAFQPPNAELEMLTSGGLLGLLVFLILQGGALKRLRRLEPTYGTLAFAAVLMRFVQGQFDIFWVAGQSAIPWMIAGIALGVGALGRAKKRGLEPLHPGRAGPALRARASSG